MGRGVRNLLLVGLLTILAAAGCGDPASDRAGRTASDPAGGAGASATGATGPSTTPSGPPATPSGPPATPSGPPTGRPGAPATTVPGFTHEISTVTAADLGASWRPGCPVGPDQLRRIRLGYWDFDSRPQIGTIVVHRSVTAEVIKIFAALYRERFPIRRLQPVDAYAGSDDRSMADDNTSGFNCRRAVSNGAAKWSAHAYGRAIDVNPVENPYLIGGRVLPPAGAAYRDRSGYRPGMAVPGGVLVEAFAAAGWQWGGGWRSPDYQHFTRTGG